MADLTGIKSAAPRLPVADLRRSLEFYSTLLGFRTLDLRPENDPTEALVSKNDAHLRLIAESEPGGDPRGEATVTIRVDNATGLHGLLAAKVEIDTRWVGFDIPNEFVVGYGLDFAEGYRNLRDVATLAPHVYS